MALSLPVPLVGRESAGESTSATVALHRVVAAREDACGCPANKDSIGDVIRDGGVRDSHRGRATSGKSVKSITVIRRSAILQIQFCRYAGRKGLDEEAIVIPRREAVVSRDPPVFTREKSSTTMLLKATIIHRRSDSTVASFIAQVGSISPISKDAVFDEDFRRIAGDVSTYVETIAESIEDAAFDMQRSARLKVYASGSTTRAIERQSTQHYFIVYVCFNGHPIAACQPDVSRHARHRFYRHRCDCCRWG